MGERQIHGFNFEQEIIEKLNIVKEKNYTGKWDGYLDGIPVSIKLEKYGSDVEMADYFRNAINVEDFYLIVGFWQDKKDNIVDIQTLYINGIEWHQLFPDHFAKDFKELLDNITNSYEDDEKWKEKRLTLTAQWKQETDNLIRPRFKRDHGSQKRIQCAINNKDFFDYFVKKYKKEIGI